MSTTYLQLVNGAIVESGTSLTQLTSGDFATTTNAQAIKFKRWVQKAWLDIQTDRRNWHFMRKDGIYIVKPRIAFYDGSSSISTLFDDAIIADTNGNWTQTINGDIVVQSGTLAAGNATGYFAYKNEDNEYLISQRVKPSDLVQIPVYEFVFDDYNVISEAYPGPFAVGQLLAVQHAGGTDTFGTILAISENAGEYTLQVSMSPGIDIAATIALIEDPASVIRVPDVELTGFLSDLISSDLDLTAAFRVRGYGRYSFAEQSDSADSLLTDIQEIDIKSLNIAPYAGETGIDYSNYVDFSKLPYATYQHWAYGRGEVNRGIGQPTAFTIYPDGTYDFNSIIDKEYVLTFRYWKTPQTLSAHGDIVEGIADFYTEAIVFKALEYWAAYDNTPAQRKRVNERYMQLYYQLLRDYCDEVKMHQGAGSASVVR
jgi:hypothetical protein